MNGSKDIYFKTESQEKLIEEQYRIIQEQYEHIQVLTMALLVKQRDGSINSKEKSDSLEENKELSIGSSLIRTISHILNYKKFKAVVCGSMAGFKGNRGTNLTRSINEIIRSDTVLFNKYCDFTFSKKESNRGFKGDEFMMDLLGVYNNGAYKKLSVENAHLFPEFIQTLDQRYKKGELDTYLITNLSCAFECWPYRRKCGVTIKFGEIAKQFIQYKKLNVTIAYDLKGKLKHLGTKEFTEYLDSNQFAACPKSGQNFRRFGSVVMSKASHKHILEFTDFAKAELKALDSTNTNINTQPAAVVSNPYSHDPKWQHII